MGGSLSFGETNEFAAKKTNRQTNLKVCQPPLRKPYETFLMRIHPPVSSNVKWKSVLFKNKLFVLEFLSLVEWR